ncbi:MAG: endonuclease/exonuclease/phosphatase family protein [Treponemataceae bacterium]|nr:endonuclease/exonuclease/phosphatase family protein [Treponemataceae bacterium]
MKEKILSTLKWIGIVIASIIGLLILGFIILAIFEYRPKASENISLNGNGSQNVQIGDTYKIVSWNIGYGALGDNADFFMDGGDMVDSSTKNRVKQNVEGISNQLEEFNPDFVFLQEVDTKAKRSYRINEVKTLAQKFSDFQTSFAYNFRVIWSPVPGLLYAPLPGIFTGNPATMGKVNCGIMTLSKADASSSTRIQLPCPFSWPLRIVNLKRCIMVNRLPIAGTDKELVLVNLHLEAYDSGEGKIAQTKMLRSIFDTEVAKGNYVIAGGDFNQTFSSVDLSKYPIRKDKHGNQCWTPGIIATSDFSTGTQLIMDSRQPSCRSLDKPLEGADLENFQFYVIDGFIVSPNVKINKAETVNLNFKNSDHNPVVMSFTLK